MFKTSTPKTTMFIAAALCTVGLFSAPAAFAKSVEVRYADLDLASAQGQKTLDLRINAAARKVCDYAAPTTGSRLPDESSVACYHKARADVRDQVAVAIDKSSDDTRLGG